MIQNDQGELIEQLKNEEYSKAWHKVRFVGVQDEPDIMARFLVFEKAADSFDPEKNNNFIGYYKNFLKFHSIERRDSEQVKVTSNRSVINLMRQQATSPQDDIPDIVNDLMKINY